MLLDRRGFVGATVATAAATTAKSAAAERAFQTSLKSPGPIPYDASAYARLLSRVSPGIVCVEIPGDHRAAPSRLSGFFVTRNGYICTASRPLRGMDRVMVTLHGGEPLSASLIGRIKSNDLAVLKVERGGQEALPLSPLARPSAGESLLAIGHGFSFRSVGFTGMVAAETSAKSMLRVNGFPHIELVGAPVFDVKGRLVGLNTSMFTRRRKTSVRVASSDVIAQAMSLLGLAGGKLS